MQRFFLCGRLIFGPDVRSLLVTVFLIVAPMVIFCYYIARNLFYKFAGSSGIAVLVAAVVWTSIVSH
jgi:palmitoyltransferase ZDHHC9/14/18